MRPIVRLGFAVLGMLSAVNLAAAQDMRIYTQIRIRPDEGSNQSAYDQQPLVKSVMIFHAGKVYDYIEPAQEVTVYEPALRRFTVLNKLRQLRSELRQDQILHFLDLAQNEAQKRILQNDSASSRRSLELLQFQLQPSFSVAFEGAHSEDATSRLVLESSYFQYVVNGFTPKVPEIVDSYLRVADWTAQLNSVLHPNSLLPYPRMILNQELRQRGLIPSTVELAVESDPAIHLIATHQWTWNLKETDRQMISDWDRIMQDSTYRNLPFRQFQQEVLKTDTARRR